MPDFTQQQTDEQQRDAQAMSLKRTQPPGQAPGYRTEEFIGAGAFGEVWRAVDTNTGRQVAIKFFTHRGRVDWSLLRREVEKLVFLAADRYVVQLLDVGWEADPPYYVMDYIPEGSLEDYLENGRMMHVAEAVEMVREIGVGLMHMHGKGVLHCDLKPANVLLDQDRKPRLADFGQSRLTHEQQPALGTLFYMAPEQADLSATPDARWDVYALGALLYRMLTGEPPHKTPDFVRQIDTAKDLSERLDRYRRLIERLPPPREHRRVAGVDRKLAEIVDRCLKSNPRDRFPSVQSMLEALRAREQARDLLALKIGALGGPLLLLAIMLLFGWIGYRGAVGASDEAVTARVRESNGYAAKFVAASVSRDLEQYLRQVEQAAASEELRGLMAAFEINAALKAQMRTIADPKASDEEKKAARAVLLASNEHAKLQAHVELLMAARPDLHAASWFTTDVFGNHLADKFDVAPSEKDNPLGKNFARRPYFSGLTRELSPQEIRRPLPEHLSGVFLTPVFQSSASRTWKVAISSPVYDIDNESKFLGIVAVTIEMGKFANALQDHAHVKADEKEAAPRQFAVLVADLEGQLVILQHPLFDKILAQKKGLPKEFVDRRYQVRLDDPALVSLQSDRPDPRLGAQYHDPMAQYAEGGAAFERPYIAATAVVPAPRISGESTREASQRESGLFVLVQEDREAAIAPVHELGKRLAVQAALAVAGVIATIVGVWLLLMRMLSSQSAVIQETSVGRATPTPQHSAETVPAGKT